MGFWQNVEDELEYKNISRKELAAAAKFSVNTISTGIKRNGMPEADLAFRIATALNVPLETLLDPDAITVSETDRNSIMRQQKLFMRYLPLVEKLDSMPSSLRKAIITIIENQN